MTVEAGKVCVTPHEFLLEGTGERARTGVLLVHGLTGTPNEMRLLAKGLNKAGFTVYAVQLAGHCGTIDDLVATRWQDWYTSVLAEERPDLVAGVCALSTTFRHDGWSIPAYTKLGDVLLPLFRALGLFRHKVFMEMPPYGIKDEALRKHVVAQMQSGDSAAAGLPGNPWWSIVEMHRLSARVLKRLGAIQSPCLVIHAANDDISAASNAHDIVRGVTLAPVELLLLDDSYHMITIDRERRAVIARTAAFVARIAAGGTRAGAAAMAVQAVHG
jgi:carboxylesterase